MTTPLILTTSGFILPQTNYHEVLSSDKIKDTSMLNRNLVIRNTYAGINEYSLTNDVYHSTVANTAYLSFIDDQSFVKYITLVDIATEILSLINFSSFFEIQANNRNLSQVSFLFCIDLYKGEFIKNHLKYDSVPMGARFTSEVNTSTDLVNKNLRALSSLNRNNNWVSFLADLSNNKDAFCTFFKYIFTDAYN